jgi:hypothetical protein
VLLCAKKNNILLNHLHADFHVNYYSNCYEGANATPTIVYYALHNVSSVSGPISVSGGNVVVGATSAGSDVSSAADNVATASNPRKPKSLAGECASVMAVGSACLRQNSLLYLLLMLGTVWLGLSLYNFTKT